MGAGGANSYTIRGRTRMDPLTIRYGSQSKQQTKRRRRSRRRRRRDFSFMNVWIEIVRETHFEQTNFLEPLDLCSSLSGGAIYSLFG